MGAIAFGWIVEEREAARLRGRQLLLAGQIGVVLAAEGLKLAVILLIGLEGLQNGLERRAGVGEDRCAKGLAQLGGVGRAFDCGDDGCRTAVGHLERREQRQPRLIAPAIHPTVPGQPAGRPVIDAGVCFVVGVVIMFGELRRRLHVAKRGDGAQSHVSHVLAAGLDRARIRRTIGVRGIVAGGAGQLARCRERRIEEQAAPDRGQHAGLSVDDGPRQSLLRRRQGRGACRDQQAAQEDIEQTGHRGSMAKSTAFASTAAPALGACH